MARLGASGLLLTKYRFQIFNSSSTLQTRLHLWRLDCKFPWSVKSHHADSRFSRDNISLHDVPFQANVSDIELSLSLALIPRITLDLQLVEGLISVQVGPSFDLPKTTVTVTQLATDSVDAQCERSNGTSVSAAYQTDFQHLFQNLTHIATEVELGVGFDMKGSVSELPGLDLSSSIELATLPIAALPTQCLAFRNAASATPIFTPAVSALKEVQASVAASASSASASAASASRSSAAAAQSSAAQATGGGGSEQSAAGQRNSAAGARNSLCAFLVLLGFAIL